MHLLQKQNERINQQKIVYHGSVQKGLKVINPNKCKHDESFVYVSENIPLCVIFAVKRTGENISFGVNTWGKPFINEFYEGAFEDRFKNKPCYIYKLPKNQFNRETEFLELVSRKPVEVIDCIEVLDSASFLLDFAKKGKLKIGRYNLMTKKQKEEQDLKLRKTLKQYINFQILSPEQYNKLDKKAKLSYDTKKTRRDFCLNKFPELMKELEKENKV